MRKNNFDILRLLCALLVVLSHSYALLGLNNMDGLLRLSGCIIWSDVGLCGFFTISGYLIAQSFFTSKNVFSYFVKRCLRIFPGLLVCLILCVFVCRFFYSGTSYWCQPDTSSFVWRNLLLYPVQYEISGVFDANPSQTVNGSLWTLCYEFTMYILLIFLLPIKKASVFSSRLSVLVIGVLVVCLIVKNTVFADNFAHTEILFLNVSSFSRFAQYFMTGTLLFFLHVQDWKNKLYWLAGSMLLFVGLIIISKTMFAMLFLSFAIIIVGTLYTPILSVPIKRIGDLSYGTYIYSFWIQQVVISVFYATCKSEILTPMWLFLFTCIAVFPIAYLSFHFVEKPMLGLKKYL